MQDLLIVNRTALFDSPNPVKHDISAVHHLKEVRRPTSRYQPKHMLFVAVVIHNVNDTWPHTDRKTKVSRFLSI